jgi:hypothetical protein
LWQRSAKGQLGAGPNCSGRVSDTQGNGVANLGVEIVAPGGGVTTGNTDARGAYRVVAPKTGPYVILFREPQGNTRLLDLRQLTAGTNQILSVTIDPPTKSFQGAYSALQAVEALSAWMMADREGQVAGTLFKTIPFGELRGIVQHVMDDINRVEPTDRQRQFLMAKTEAVQKLLGMTG